MKKIKGVAAMESSPYPVAFEDPRARLRFQSLLQDYQDLQQETDAMKKKMQTTKQRKLTLLAEVRFLRRRFEYLTKNNYLHLKHSQIPSKGKPRNSEMRSKQSVKKRNHAAIDASLQPIASRFESSKKPRIGSGKKAVLQNSKPGFFEKAVTGRRMASQSFSPVFDWNQGDSVPIPSRNLGLVFDLNKKERPSTGKEAFAQPHAPIFDLNQISRDEEELQNNAESLGIEEARRGSILDASEEQLNRVKLPGCRNVGNGLNKATKRKITWQDQVALRV